MQRALLSPLCLTAFLFALACSESGGGSETETPVTGGTSSSPESTPGTPSAVEPTTPTNGGTTTPPPASSPTDVPGPATTPGPGTAGPAMPGGAAGADGAAGSDNGPGEPAPASGGAGPEGSGGTAAAGANNGGVAGDDGEGGSAAGGLGGGGGAAGNPGAAGAMAAGGMPATADAVAVATLASTGVDPGHDDITGTATFTQVGDAVTLVLELDGCPMGPHVSHIHVMPDCGNEGNAAGNHWLPNGELLDDYECDAEGTASYTLTVEGGQWTIGAGDDTTDVDGHSFMVHIGSTVSPGDRVACGVIEQQ